MVSNAGNICGHHQVRQKQHHQQQKYRQHYIFRPVANDIEERRSGVIMFEEFEFKKPRT
jgi:hypothetical protein